METRHSSKAADDADIIIRPKSSKRKRRSDEVEHVARKPSQSRSLKRFSKILETAERLLETYNIEDISFYDIARAAKISPASINYLFPTMAALQIELSKKYGSIGTQVTVRAHRAQARSKNPSWQVWMYKMGEYAKEHFNASRSMSEVLLGPQLHRESSRSSISETRIAAQELLSSLKEFFIFPEIPGIEDIFSRALDMVEAAWSRAYLLHGHIDEESFEQSMRMQIAYLRTVLPDTLPVRTDDPTTSV